MRITDLSPRIDNALITTGGDYQSVSGKALCIVCSSGGQRVYLGGHSGVWRSIDGGLNWQHMERPQPSTSQPTVPGALAVTNVYDLWVHPHDPNVVLAAVGRDFRRPEASGVYRSSDGGSTWTLTHQFLDAQGQPRMACTFAGVRDVPDLVYAAGEVAVAVSDDGGQTWQERRLGAFATVNHVLVGPAQAAHRHAYAFGSGVWHSNDGGATWRQDAGGPSLGPPTDSVGESSRAAALHPSDARVVYVRRARRVGEETVEEILKGAFPADDGPATWTLLPNPPIGYAGTTASGGSFVLAHRTPDGQLLLLVSDRRTIHVAVGEPASESDWVRVDGDPVHVDPHGIAASTDFTRSPASQMGRLFVVSDGGAYVSRDGARTWTQGRGLSTLGLVNAAVLSVDGEPRGICIQMGDNSGFYSRNGGQTWRTQDYLGGDNDCTFADPRQPDRLIVFAPRSGKREVFLYVDPGGNVPDASIGTQQRHTVKGPPLAPDADDDDKALWNTVSSYYGAGYRPLVLTLHNEQPRPDGDFVTIWTRFEQNRALLLRTTAMSSITQSQDWITNATAEGPGVKVFQQGPDLPTTFDLAQASGGHQQPTFTVAESEGLRRVMRWRSGMAEWQPLVPASSGGPMRAQRFFVDPYRPDLIYVLDADHVWRTDNGGAAWLVDSALERILTLDGFSFSQRGRDALLRDMAFDPQHPFRFAVGPRGVFHTLDGQTWEHLALSTALAAQLNNLFYDPGIMPCDRALYVSTSARGLLRLHPLPPEWDTPIGSINSASGRVTVLRMHEVGTGFGPPSDRLDAEVIVQLDTEPGKAFGFTLRADSSEPKAQGHLAQLRSAFRTGRPVRLEYERTGCRTGKIVRVIGHQGGSL